MLLDKMRIQTNDSTSMACFYLCTMGVLKLQSNNVFPLWTFFKDWSFQRTRFAAFTDFERSRELIFTLDGIKIDNSIAYSLDEMIQQEKLSLSKGLFPICSVDAYSLDYHPYYKKKHSGHFVVLTNISEYRVTFVDIELNYEGVLTPEEWKNIRSYSESARSIDLFTVEKLPEEKWNTEEEFQYVSKKNILTMKGGEENRGGLREMSDVENAIRSKDDKSMELFTNHFGMRTSRYQHGKYLKHLNKKIQSNLLEDLSESFFPLSKEWGKLHLICSKFQFNRQEKHMYLAADKIYQIIEMEDKILRQLESFVRGR